MRSTQLYMRQQADTARQQIKHERRKEGMKEVRQQINIYLEEGMEITLAVNYGLDSNKISIIQKKEVRQHYRYGCHTIYSIAEALSDIKRQNSLDFVLESV